MALWRRSVLSVKCPRCGNQHHAQEEHTGKLLKCSQCGDAVQIGAKKLAASLAVGASTVIDAGSVKTHKSAIWPWAAFSGRQAKNRKLKLVSIVLLLAVSGYFMRPASSEKTAPRPVQADYAAAPGFIGDKPAASSGTAASDKGDIFDQVIAEDQAQHHHIRGTISSTDTPRTSRQEPISLISHSLANGTYLRFGVAPQD